jgi:hypothetical protein
LVTDREHSIPVLNNRTGARGVAFGESGGAPLLELRYMATNADIEVDDVLTTSGVDGVYPPGIPVAKVVKVERRADSVFARILCQSSARIQGARHVMVLSPVKLPVESPPIERAVVVQPKGGQPMIMPRGQQLLLPANPSFMLFTMVVALLLDMMQSMALFGNAAWTPDWVALLLVFWGVHQPLKVGVGISFFMGLLTDVHQTLFARAARTGVHCARVFGHHDSPTYLVV